MRPVSVVGSGNPSVGERMRMKTLLKSLMVNFVYSIKDFGNDYLIRSTKSKNRDCFTSLCICAGSPRCIAVILLGRLLMRSKS